jgi:hypothetical protein
MRHGLCLRAEGTCEHVLNSLDKFEANDIGIAIQPVCHYDSSANSIMLQSHRAADYAQATARCAHGLEHECNDPSL